MVQDTESKNLRRLSQLVVHTEIGFAGVRVAAGVVVGKDDSSAH